MRPRDPAEASAFVQEQVRKLAEEVLPLAEHDRVVAATVDEGSALGECLHTTVARSPGEAAAVGHSLIVASAALGSIVLTARAGGRPADELSTGVNVLALAGMFLIGQAELDQARSGQGPAL
ncbi:hypothetical protein Celgi_1326 [Cellulomonas gilvus ATCC 13127]|uniref:Uncharacterized protein n=2 Tax=Cellulomonas gilvus TaxID=11 RepID=F8A2Z0_CELGA|nr:hypothetical protein Celgi_1326 [Cellulomonas gilvus ATCC 13127]